MRRPIRRTRLSCERSLQCSAKAKIFVTKNSKISITANSCGTALGTSSYVDSRILTTKGVDCLYLYSNRLTNFVGILSQGLRIAPPEAPSTGYMFGKGGTLHLPCADLSIRDVMYKRDVSVNRISHTYADTAIVP